MLPGKGDYRVEIGYAGPDRRLKRLGAVHPVAKLLQRFRCHIGVPLRMRLYRALNDFQVTQGGPEKWPRETGQVDK